MFTREASSRRATTLALALALGGAACAGPEGHNDTTSPPGPSGANAGTEIAPRVASDWVGYRLGASPGKWTDRGALKQVTATIGDGTSAGDETTEVLRVRVDERLVAAPRPARDTVVMGDPRLGRVYEIAMGDGDRSLIAQHLEQLGYANGNDGDGVAGGSGNDTGTATDGAGTDSDSDSDAIVPKSWSFGVDDRKPFGIAEYGVAAAAINRIGTLSKTTGGKVYTCTATFVGTPTSGYFVITAAHCFWQPGTGAYLDPDFYPRRDGCKKADGTTIAGCNTQPYGQWDGLGWLMPSYFHDNCRGLSDISRECAAADIAIMEVARPSGVSFPGAMGFGAFRFADLSALSKFSRGYPGCSATGHPASCRSNTLYGETKSCALGAASYPDGDGWHQLVEHGCDASPGHSGSGMYVSSSGYKVFGVYTSDDACYSTSCGTATPNLLRRITPYWYDSMLSFMGQ